MRIFSDGGGVQSTAAKVLAVQGKIDFRVFVFANVGDDSENPETLIYNRTIGKEFCERNGLGFYEIARENKDGETLLQMVLREEKSICIPVRMRNGAPGNRTCTTEFKRKTIHKFLGKGDHVVGLGISMDEFQRMRTDSGFKNVVNEYPLIDLRLSRKDCVKIIQDAGLPLPPKSSCWFCPYRSIGYWRTLYSTRPDLYRKSVDLEQIINRKRAAIGKDPVYLTGKGRTLDLAVGEQPSLFQGIEEDACEIGYCMT